MSDERTELGVDEVRENNGMIEVDCWHNCYDEMLVVKFPYCQIPKSDLPVELKCLVDSHSIPEVARALANILEEYGAAYIQMALSEGEIECAAQLEEFIRVWLETIPVKS